MSNETEMGLLPWILAGVASIMGALSTALVYVFKKAEYDNALAIKELKETSAELFKRSIECEKVRSDLHASCEVLKFQVENLAARVKSIDKTGTEFSHKQDGK